MDNRTKKYDIAFSFAGEDRSYVESVASFLHKRGVEVFYDEFYTPEMWGKNLLDYLYPIYKKESEYVVMFISRHYVSKPYPGFERQAMQEEWLEIKDYILPARFDDTEVPSLPSTISYVDLRKVGPEEFGKLILEKLGHNLSKSIDRYYTMGEQLTDQVQGFKITPSTQEDGARSITIKRTDGQHTLGIAPRPSASASVINFITKGEPVELTRDQIAELRVPIALTPIINLEDIEKVEVQRQVDASVTIPIRLRHVANSGAATELGGISLHPKQAGTKEATLCSPANSALRLTLTLRLDNGSSTFALEYHQQGSVKKNLDYLRFIEKLADGGTLEIVHDETDRVVSRAELGGVSLAKPPAEFLTVLEKLGAIQNLSGVTFDLPQERISATDVELIYRLEQILSTGVEELEGVAFKGEITLDQARRMLSTLPRDEHFRFGVNGSGLKAVLFGREIHLGDTFVTIEQGDFENGWGEFELQVSSAPESVNLVVKQVPGSPARQYYKSHYKGDDLLKEGIS